MHRHHYKRNTSLPGYCVLFGRLTTREGVWSRSLGVLHAGGRSLCVSLALCMCVYLFGRVSHCHHFDLVHHLFLLPSLVETHIISREHTGQNRVSIPIMLYTVVKVISLSRRSKYYWVVLGKWQVLSKDKDQYQQLTYFGYNTSFVAL